MKPGTDDTANLTGGQIQEVLDFLIYSGLEPIVTPAPEPGENPDSGLEPGEDPDAGREPIENPLPENGEHYEWPDQPTIIIVG